MILPARVLRLMLYYISAYRRRVRGISYPHLRLYVKLAKDIDVKLLDEELESYANVIINLQSYLKVQKRIIAAVA